MRTEIQRSSSPPVAVPNGRRRSSVAQKKLSEYRAKVAEAVQQKKIFRVVSSYDAPKIRFELEKRGFLEQKAIPWHSIYYQMPLQMLVEEAERDDEAEKALIAKLMGHCTPNCMWVTRPQCYDISHGIPLLNRIRFTGLNFSVKDEMCEYVARINERLGSGAEILFPRTYVIAPENEKEITLFRREFKFTIIVSLILYLYQNQPTSKYFAKLNDSVQVEGLDFALRYVEKMAAEVATLESLGNDELRMEIGKMPARKTQYSVIQWRQVFIAHEDVVKWGRRFRVEGKEAEEYIARIRKAALFILKHFPQRHYEGYYGIFMLKPAWSGQGEGIVLSDNRMDIINFLKRAGRKYIVQKYIERPLLVYRTKFDLRQYFLISMDRYYFRGWSHPNCSVKFASKEFSLKYFDEAIHITNTSIQMKYKDRTTEELPEHHMWSSDQLETHFNRMGFPNAFNEVVYPEIKRILKAFTIASYGNIELRPGRYELLGCDFLITDDLKTYLIEINRAPSLEKYTPVSNRLLDSVLEDLIKVTVDFGKNKNADTGGFEVVHQIKLSERRNTIDDIRAEVVGGKNESDLGEPQKESVEGNCATLVRVAA